MATEAYTRVNGDECSIMITTVTLAAAAATAAAAGAAMGAACASDMDCSLNGLCRHQQGVCCCDAGWESDDCGVLKLGRTLDNAIGSGRIYPPPASNTSSWGGGVVEYGGKYHLYVSEMAGHCGLGTWATNSFIRHATADTVDGIYTPQETVLETWSHNAMPWVTPEGYVSVWHIGNGTALRPEKTGCNNGTTPLRTVAQSSRALSHAGPVASADRIGAPAPVQRVPYSLHPGGAWKTMEITCDTGAAGLGPCPIDNPTPLAFNNRTTLLAHRTRGGFGILVAPHWSGPYKNVAGGNLSSTNVPSPDDEFSCEDGFLFHGQRGGIHLLCHCNGIGGYPWDDHGRHAFSRDGTLLPNLFLSRQKNSVVILATDIHSCEDLIYLPPQVSSGGGQSTERFYRHFCIPMARTQHTYLASDRS